MRPLFSHSREFFLAALFALLSGAVALTAQTPDASAGAPASGGDSLNYQNAPVGTILDLYEQLSGEHLIRDPSLNNAAQTPNISLNATGLTKAERLKFFEEALLFDGIAIVPIDDHTAKVVATQAQQKNPRSEGVKLYANAADLPATDEIVSYYMTLNYITPQEAQTIFMDHAPIHTYGKYVPAPSAQAIVLTENVNVIRELIELKELIDVPPAKVTSKFVQLNGADAEKVADLLNKMLDPKSNPAAAGAAPPQPGGAAIVPAGFGNDAPLSNEHNLISGTAQIIPDTRSNRLLIITRPVNLPFLEQLISQLDQPDTFMIPQRRPLKYVLAEDILPALEAALAQGKDEEDQVKNQSATNNGTTGKTGTTPTPTASSSGSSTSGSGSISAVTPQLEAPPENNVPTVVTIGNTKLMADNRSNSIIIFGSPDVSSRVFSMIDQLDRKPLQVYLGTVIGQLTVSEGQEFGIDILQKFQHVGQGGLASSLVTPGTTTTGSSAVPNPASLISSLGFPLPTGLTLYGAIGSTLDAYVRALESTNRFKMISTPSVYTTNNKLAVIASGQQIPVLSNIASSYGSGTTDGTANLVSTGSVTYQDVLLQLDIIPLINANHDVTLKIRQTNNTLGGNNVINGNNVPTILTQEINTEVTVPDKSTVVIGGLISDQRTRDTSGVPWLSDIPVLGYLFKDTKKNKERDELIIMIQPSVVETDQDQIVVNDAEKKKTILGNESIGTDMDTFPGDHTISFHSTSTQSSSYNSKTGTSTKTAVTVSSGTTPAHSVPPVAPGSMPTSLGTIPTSLSPAAKTGTGPAVTPAPEP